MTASASIIDTHYRSNIAIKSTLASPGDQILAFQRRVTARGAASGSWRPLSIDKAPPRSNSEEINLTNCHSMKNFYTDPAFYINDGKR
ncbi:hypothetical protein G3O00_03930 [Burkholderia sp. Ac-20384]|uniref:hypothetical protein n=1 Tax=Burkholderia sp. Ac-20384 TaxID=2703902 RepID=UPI00197CE806|nr:hypothetical protein [Burkholderia sp. Ac-20384]MBN3822766.1 hypothetical protein [Burkholderia sp. Ac-20384]